MLHNAISQVTTFLSGSLGRLFDVSGFRGVLFVFVFLFSYNSLPFIADAFTLRVSLEVLLLCSAIDTSEEKKSAKNDEFFCQ